MDVSMPDSVSALPGINASRASTKFTGPNGFYKFGVTSSTLSGGSFMACEAAGRNFNTIQVGTMTAENVNLPGLKSGAS